MTDQLEWLHVGLVWLSLRLGLARALATIILVKSVLPNNTMTDQLEWLHVGPVWLNLRLGLARVLATLILVSPLAKLAPSLAKRWPSSWLG